VRCADARLAAFREELARRKLAGFRDSPCRPNKMNMSPLRRALAWLTGFTGSAGMAIVLTQAAAVLSTADIRSGGEAGRCQGLELEPLDSTLPGSLAGEASRGRRPPRILIHGCTLLRQPNGWPRSGAKAGAN